MLSTIFRSGGYEHAVRELGGYLSGAHKLQALRRSQYRNMAFGITIGTAIGVATGLLIAPRSGRETRDAIAVHSSNVMRQLKESAHQAAEHLQNDPSIQRAAETAQESTEAIEEEAQNLFK
jgi:gas vesicle protein